MRTAFSIIYRRRGGRSGSAGFSAGMTWWGGSGRCECGERAHSRQPAGGAMELGLALPVAGPQTSPDTIVEVAKEAERLGFAALWTFERLLRPLDKVVLWTGGEPDMVPEFYGSVYEPLETLRYVAAATQRIKLGTAVVVAPLHAPVTLARRFATLDRISGGRAVAGLGQGWQHQEFETANVPIGRKGARTEEFVTAMRAAWGPDPVAHDG